MQLLLVDTPLLLPVSIQLLSQPLFSRMPALQPTLRGLENTRRGDIRALYSGARVLVTGATGFLGKVLVEFLLRKTSVEKVFLLVRTKNNKSAEERLGDILKEPIFSKIREVGRGRLSAACLVSGDVALPNLGLSDKDRNQLIDEVDVIFHGAATVAFNSDVDTAMETNFDGVRHVMQLAQDISKLKVIMHVSTAFSNHHLDCIDEKIYPIRDKNSFLKIPESISTEKLKSITTHVLKESPNAYMYSKRLAEHFIHENCRGLPVGIFRPAGVIGAVREPVGGWVDNLYGPTGVSIGIMLGLVHSVVASKEKKSQLVPVDSTANCLIAAASDTYSKYSTSGADSHGIPVYNMVSSPDSPLTWGRYVDHLLKEGRRVGCEKSLWYPFLLTSSSWTMHRLKAMLLHYAPAILADLASYALGRKPRWTKAYAKIDRVVTILIPFSTKEWKFGTQNVEAMWKSMSQEERQAFPFNMQGFDWDQYLPIYLQGSKKFLIKDKYNEEEGKKKAKRLKMIHYMTFISLITASLGLGVYLTFPMK